MSTPTSPSALKAYSAHVPEWARLKGGPEGSEGLPAGERLKARVAAGRPL